MAAEIQRKLLIVVPSTGHLAIKGCESEPCFPSHLKCHVLIDSLILGLDEWDNKSPVQAVLKAILTLPGQTCQAYRALPAFLHFKTGQII